MTAPKFNTWWSVSLKTGLDCTCILWAPVTATRLVGAFSLRCWFTWQAIELSARFPTQTGLYSHGSSVAARSAETNPPANRASTAHCLWGRSPPKAQAPRDLPALLCSASSAPCACSPSGCTCRPQAFVSIPSCCLD